MTADLDVRSTAGHAKPLVRRVDGVEMPVAGTWTVPDHHATISITRPRALGHADSWRGRASEAAVIVDGTERARLIPGDFFGEMSILTGDVPVADVVVVSDSLRCAQLPGDQLRPLLVRHPTIAIRMLEIVARRLRAANRFEP